MSRWLSLRHDRRRCNRLFGIDQTGALLVGCETRQRIRGQLQERFYLPLLGILHSAPALYPILFDPGSIGFGGWLILIAFMALLAMSVRSFWRRIVDPTIGASFPKTGLFAGRMKKNKPF